MTHFRKYMDQELLGAWDLPEDRDVVVTIAKVIGGELTGIGGKKSKKPVVTFVGKEKKMVFNVTNCKAVAGMYGNHVEKWEGKKVALYISTARSPSDGTEVPCIRVRPTVPAPKQDHQEEGAGI